MVAVGGFRPTDGGLFYTNRSYEHVLIDVRTRMLETQNIRTRASYLTIPRNYGNLDEEMQAERTLDGANQVDTPNANAGYANGGDYLLQRGTPLFIETMNAEAIRYVSMVGENSTPNSFTVGTSTADVRSDLLVGTEVEINGEIRTIDSYTPPTATSPGLATVSQPFSSAPNTGSLILLKGREYTNIYLNEVYRVTDKYGSYSVDQNRYMVDRDWGLVRYRPEVGNFNPNAIWHPENQLDKPYYFGRMVPVKEVPAPAGPATDGVVGNEELGNPTDPVAATANPAASAVPPNPGVLTAYNRVYPDGQFSNIRVTAPPGTAFEVELNGAKLAIVSEGGSVLIPFFDPDFNNDQLKANQSIDPDIYIQRFIKEGNNHLTIKAIRTVDTLPSGAAAQTGIRVEGVFNGVNLETGAVANVKPHSAVSVMPLDWSASGNSVLGIVGKVDFNLGDQIALEDVNDEIQKAQGVLESLSTLIAGTDLNQFQSMLSIIR
ncbi:MAG: hypothetical protein ACO1RX_13225 [Candidatus Sericytochromatia bacterium]